MNARVTMIVLTGGPCGYKSDILAGLPKALAPYGLTTHVVPEAATLLKGQGITPERVGLLHFQDMLFRHILHLEHLHQEVVTPELSNTIIVCDRGLMDGAAFVTHDDFEHIARRHHFDLESLGQRYRGVLHLESLAVRQSGLYAQLCHGNPVRQETAAQAAALDGRIREAWAKYCPGKVLDVTQQPGVGLLPNRAQRQAAVVQAICQMIELPAARVA